jgi:hypothetical protein
MTLSLKASIAGALALSVAAGVAFAQPPAGGAGGGGSGRGAALRQACGADIEKFCPNLQPGPDMRACVRKNYASLSDGCRSVLDQMRSQRQQQGAPGGAAPAPQ